MTGPEIIANINALGVRQLVAAMRFLKGGPLGYDFSKLKKGELQERADQLAQAYNDKHHSNGQGWAGTWKDIQEALTDTRSNEGGSEKAEGGKEDDAQGQGQGQGEGEGQEEKEGKGDGKPKEGKPKKQPEGKLAQGIQDLIKETMGDIPSQDDIEAMVKMLVEDELNKHNKVFRVEVKRPKGEVFEQGEEPRHKAFKEALAATAAGLNVMYVGPAGCGKTKMAEQVSDALGLDFRFTGAVASEYKLLGFMNAQGVPVRTEYREAYEKGGVFLWDEIDASAPQAMLSFNAGLANGHQDFPDVVVKRHDDFRAIASANTYGNGADRIYVGRNQLDAASLDRFYVIPMDYDEDLEKILYGTDEWVTYVQRARAAIKKLNIRHVVSMRAIDQGLRMKGSGIARKGVERAVLWKHLPDADIKKIKEQM